MNVLSLFDGISCGRLALEKSKINIDQYYASEINDDSIKIALNNFPDIRHIGDITRLIGLDEKGNINFVSDIMKNLPKIDLLIGGSPCQGISKSKPIRENLKDPRSGLFFHFVKIKEWLIENNNSKLKFILENVEPNNETLEIMNSKMGITPIKINSDKFSAQDRLRLYWTNIKIDLNNIIDKQLYITDIMELNQSSEKIRDLKDNEKYLKSVKFGKNAMAWDTSGKGHYSQQNRARYTHVKMNTLPKKNGGDKTRIHLGEYKYRNATITELERLQTLPDGYTNCIKSKATRKGLVGDGWTIDVIVYILNELESCKRRV